MNLRLLLVAGLAAASFLLASVVPAPIAGFGSTCAFAKGGNGNGRGNDGGRGNGNAADRGGKTGNGNGGPASSGSPGGASAVHGASSGHKPSPAADPPDLGAVTEGAAPGADKNAATLVKNVPDAVAAGSDANDKSPDAKLGALHAVDANLQAFVHAAPNSQVGRIAAYARALVALQGAAAAVTSADEALTAAEIAFTEATATRDTALGRLLSAHPDLDPTTLQPTVNDLNNIVQDGGGDDKVMAEIAAINCVIAAEAGVAAAQNALVDATANLADAQAAAGAAGRAADDALTAAANKSPVDASVRTYVDEKLRQDGILDYYRSLKATSSSSR